MVRSRAAAATAAVLALALVAGCSGGGDDDEPSAAATSTTTTGSRDLTAEEADRLATTRFRLFQAGGVHVTTTVRTQGTDLRVEGDVDLAGRVGYAQVDGLGESFTFQWNDTILLSWPGERPPTGLPTAEPTSRPLDPTLTTVDAVLALALQLGQDRPDNAQLLRQNGAAWLRSDRIGDVAVDVFQGPEGGNVNYWLDADGNLLRVEAFLGGAADATTLDLDPGAYVPVTRSSALPA